jgi:hypothetical protein
MKVNPIGISMENGIEQTFNINSKLKDLLILFSNGKKFIDDLDLDEYYYDYKDRLCHNTKFEDLSEKLNIDINDLIDIFNDRISFKIYEEIALEAIESFIDYKISRNSNVSISLILDKNLEDVTAIIKTKRTLDSILHEGMEAYGDFDYHSHCDEDKDTLKNDFYYILKYLIYYYIACNGGSIKPYLKIEVNLDNYWKYPSIDELELICDKLIETGELSVRT